MSAAPGVRGIPNEDTLTVGVILDRFPRRDGDDVSNPEKGVVRHGRGGRCSALVIVVSNCPERVRRGSSREGDIIWVANSAPASPASGVGDNEGVPVRPACYADTRPARYIRVDFFGYSGRSSGDRDTDTGVILRRAGCALRCRSPTGCGDDDAGRRFADADTVALDEAGRFQIVDNPPERVEDVLLKIFAGDRKSRNLH